MGRRRTCRRRSILQHATTLLLLIPGMVDALIARRAIAFPTSMVNPTVTPTHTPTPRPPWPMTGHDARHSQRSSYRGPDEASLLWTYTAHMDEVINLGTTVDPDGTVYFGTWGRYLTTSFRSVCAVSPDSAALVSDINGGIDWWGTHEWSAAILRRSGAGWEKLFCPIPRKDLNSINMLSESEGRSVGDGGTVLRYDGNSWQADIDPENPPTANNLNGVSLYRAGSRTYGWAVGDAGTILRYDGSWQEYPHSLTNNNLQDIAFLPDGSKGWACGTAEDQNMFEYSSADGAWGALPGFPGTYYSIDIVDSDNAWAVGGYWWWFQWCTVFLRYDGTGWSVEDEIWPGPKLYSVSFKDENEGWAVGEEGDGSGSGTIWYYNGSGWAEHSQSRGVGTIHSVSMLQDGTGWAVGDDCAILHFNGAEWIQEASDLYTHNTTDGKYYAINSDGGLKWTYDPGYPPAFSYEQYRAGTIESTAAIDVERGRIYFGRGDGHIYAVSLATGAEIWAHDANEEQHCDSELFEYSQIFAGVTLDPEGNIYFVTAFPCISFFKLDPEGEEVWRYEVDGSLGVIVGAPAIHPDSGDVYFAARNSLYGLNSDGTLRWTYQGRSAEKLLYPAVSDDGSTVYVDSIAGQGRLHAVNSDGSVKWENPFVVEESGAGPAALGAPENGGYLYIGSSGSDDLTAHLYVLEDKGTYWSYAPVPAPVIEFTGSYGVSSPVIDCEGNLYIRAGRETEKHSEIPGMLYALNADGTSRIAPHPTPSFVLDGSCMGLAALSIGKGGELYIGDAPCHLHDCADVDNVPKLYAIGNPTTLNQAATATPTQTSTATPSPTRTPTSSPSNTPTSAPVSTGTPTHTPPRTPTATTTPTPSYTATGAPVHTATVTRTPTETTIATITQTPTGLPVDSVKLAILNKDGSGDVNIYYYNSPEEGDWTFEDAVARNPSPMARDLWVIPEGNDAIGMAAVEGENRDRLFVMKKEDVYDVNLYLYGSLTSSDWTYWDAIARNPSAMARDLWAIPNGNDAIAITAVDDMNDDGNEELAILKREGASDMNLYYYNALLPGDWTYWDCLARNPSPLARDLWIMPGGNDVAGLTSINVDSDGSELAIIRKDNAGDLNIYLYNNLVAGDWTYWDCFERNPSPLARDLWFMPAGNNTIGIAAIDADGDALDDLAILSNEGGFDVNLYYYNTIVPGDWTYLDCLARNPSPLARDLWAIPNGNDAIAMTSVRTE